jgi:hypothetical protein
MRVQRQTSQWSKAHIDFRTECPETLISVIANNSLESRAHFARIDSVAAPAPAQQFVVSGTIVSSHPETQETNMTTFSALIAPDDQANPPIQINLYSSPEIRDQLFAQNRKLPGIRSADLRLSELSDPELSQTLLMVPVEHPQFPTLLQAYLDEKVGRLKALVEADVEGALAGETSVHPQDMVWSVRFFIDGGAFAVGINGDGRLKSIEFNFDRTERPDLKRVIERASALIVRKVLPVLLRLTPRPPFIAGGSDGH